MPMMTAHVPMSKGSASDDRGEAGADGLGAQRL